MNKDYSSDKKVHDVYWGTHGCERTKGHANPCKCECGWTIPVGHAHVFGDDSDTAVENPHNLSMTVYTDLERNGPESFPEPRSSNGVSQ